MFQLLSNTSTQALPTFIASAETQNSSSGTTVVVNKPTGTLDGHLMIAFMGSASSSNSTWTGDTGWTEILDQGVSPNLRIAYKIAASEPTTYTFTTTVSNPLYGCILTYANASYDAIGTITTGANPLVISAVTASVTNCMLLGVGMRNLASLTITPPGSMTTRITNNDASGPSLCIAEEQLTSSGSSGTRTFSGFSNTNNVGGVLLTIKPA